MVRTYLSVMFRPPRSAKSVSYDPCTVYVIHLGPVPNPPVFQAPRVCAPRVVASCRCSGLAASRRACCAMSSAKFGTARTLLP